jgi:hypothetical protein
MHLTKFIIPTDSPIDNKVKNEKFITTTESPKDNNEPKHRLAKGYNYSLMSIFAILQAIVIFTFPRLNFLSFQLINR